MIRRALIVAVGLLVTSLAAADGRGAERLASRAPVDRGGIAEGGTPRDCARAYHRRLGGDVAPLTGRIWTTARELREADPTLPGYWLFWDGSGVAAKTARQRRLLAGTMYLERENRVCEHSVLARGGRIRCLQWREVPKDYEPPAPKQPVAEAEKPEITDTERAIAAGVTARVSGKGALGELAFGTALYHLAKRTADELDGYAAQDFKAQICAGAREMTAFYRTRLEPLEARERAARDLAATAVGGAKVALEAAARTFGLTAREREDGAAEPIGLSDVLNATLTPDEGAPLAGLEPDLDLLAAARDVLSEDRLAAIEPARRGALLKALQTAELAIYAGINADRLAQLHAQFQSSLAAIEDAHRTSCTCDP